MIFIFEDKFEIKEQGSFVGYIGISYLLQVAYSNTKIQLVFAESNRLLKNKLSEAIKDRRADEKIIIYMDLVADNKGTWGIFQKLTQIILQNNYKAIYVIPIPSIEYVFISSVAYVCEDKDILQIMIERKLYRKESIFIHSKYNKEGRRSFEKFTKLILEKRFREDIASNRIKVGESNFYNTTTNELGRNISVSEKSWMLWKSLPVLADSTSNSYFKTEDANVIDVIRGAVNLFLEQVELYIDKGYIDNSNLTQFKRDFTEYLSYLSTQ